MTQLKCNNCGWQGTETKLIEVPEDGKYGDGYGFKGLSGMQDGLGFNGYRRGGD